MINQVQLAIINPSVSRGLPVCVYMYVCVYTFSDILKKINNVGFCIFCFQKLYQWTDRLHIHCKKNEISDEAKRCRIEQDFVYIS